MLSFFSTILSEHLISQTGVSAVTKNNNKQTRKTKQWGSQTAQNFFLLLAKYCYLGSTLHTASITVLSVWNSATHTTGTMSSIRQ